MKTRHFTTTKKPEPDIKKTAKKKIGRTNFESESQLVPQKKSVLYYGLRPKLNKLFRAILSRFSTENVFSQRY